MDSKRVTIFTGNFGSGKTEIAINYAMNLKKESSDKTVVLADLDIVNPYFRSREKRELLENRGVEVVYPKNLEKADLPIISADVFKIIQNDNIQGVFDIGGNEDGAISLGSISRELDEDDYEMSLVVNTIRPVTSDVDGIIEMKERIEKYSRLKFDSLICNTNLGKETEIKHIKEGFKLIKKAEQKMDISLKFIAVWEKLLPLPADFQPEVDIFPVKLFMNPPWNDNL